MSVTESIVHKSTNVSISADPRDARNSRHSSGGARARVAGGANRYGEPNFRVVWGGSRLTWIGARWTDRDANGNFVRETVELRRVPKYLPTERWHVERWVPAESYGSPGQWYEHTTEIEDGIRIAALGPYPSRGEYEHCFTLEGGCGEFIPLTSAACDWIVRAQRRQCSGCPETAWWTGRLRRCRFCRKRYRR